jgi:hypothetical protein
MTPAAARWAENAPIATAAPSIVNFRIVISSSEFLKTESLVKGYFLLPALAREKFAPGGPSRRGTFGFSK